MCAFSSSAALPAASETHTSAAEFSAGEARELFEYFLETINDRYLDPVSSQDVSLFALGGLSALDPQISASVNGKTLVVTEGKTVVLSERAPSTSDTEDWADIMVSALEALKSKSLAIAKADNEALYQAMLPSALAHLDQFSRYAGAEEAGLHRDKRNGFGGVGIRYQVSKSALTIEEVIPETPAEIAGLKVGDKVTRINGVEIASIGTEEEQMRERLRGPINSELRLTVLRSDREQDFLIRRGLVMPRSVTLTMGDGDIAQIRISSFNQQTARHVQQAIKDAIAQSHSGHLRGVLLDLRGNPGGLLDQVVATADLFLTRGRIVYTKGRHQDAMQSYSASGDDMTDGSPIVVLIDGHSASSAEILSAALQDNARAVVVGTTSYGKGTVQTVLRMPNDGEMTLTWSRFHAPSGYALHRLGVLPTICVTHQDEAPNEAIRRSLSLLPDQRVPAVASYAADWRSAPLWDNAARQHLRQFCPPTDEDKWALPLAIGQELLSNPILFAQALRVSAPQISMQ